MITYMLDKLNGLPRWLHKPIQQPSLAANYKSQDWKHDRSQVKHRCECILQYQTSCLHLKALSQVSDRFGVFITPLGHP